MENLRRGAHLHTSTWGKVAIRTKATSLTHPPMLPSYLGWENVIHYIPDVRAHDTLVGQRQAFQLHRDRADNAVLRLVALLIEENPPGQRNGVG